MQDKDLFLAGNTAWWYSSGSLLHSQFLVISVDSLHLVDHVWASLMANDALGKRFLSFIRVSIVDWTLDITALAAEVHLSILREDLGSLGDHTFELNQGIKMNLAQFSKFIFYWKIVDPHINLIVEVNVVRVDLLNDLTGDGIEDRQHVGRLLCKPNRESGLLRCQICELDFKRLFVISAHISNPVLVDVNSFFSKLSEE